MGLIGSFRLPILEETETLSAEVAIFPLEWQNEAARFRVLSKALVGATAMATRSSATLD
jgi:hypothetical protein